MRGPFENPTFRRLFAGRVITNFGDSFYFVGAMWLVYSLTNDPLYTGVAGFLTMAPSALQFLAGPLVDQWSIRRTLVGTQTVQAVVVSLIPIAHVSGVLTAGTVLVVMPMLAALNQLVYPAQITALPRVLDDDELVAANSAFSIANQGMDMVANGIGGVLIGLIGAVALFVIDAVTFAIAALVFTTVYVPPPGASIDDASEPDGYSEIAGSVTTDDGGIKPDDFTPYLDRLREGMNVLRGTFLVWLIAGAAMVNFTSGMVLSAMPVYADSLGVPPALSAIGAAGGYGILMASFAAGNFLGAISAPLVAERRLGTTMIVGFGLSGVLWSGALFVAWLPFTALLLVFALLPVGAINVQLVAVVQSAPPVEFVGRVSSLMGSASAAMIPLGSLGGGVVATAFGPRAAMLGLGIGVFGMAVYVVVHPDLRGLPAPDKTVL